MVKTFVILKATVNRLWSKHAFLKSTFNDERHLTLYIFTVWLHLNIPITVNCRQTDYVSTSTDFFSKAHAQKAFAEASKVLILHLNFRRRKNV